MICFISILLIIILVYILELIICIVSHGLFLIFKLEKKIRPIFWLALLNFSVFQNCTFDRCKNTTTPRFYAQDVLKQAYFLSVSNTDIITAAISEVGQSIICFRYRYSQKNVRKKNVSMHSNSSLEASLEVRCQI